jgi:hypothetical protein
MRSFIPLIAIAMLGLSACSQQDTDSAARQAGKNAHELVIETKEAAKKADEELKKGAKEVREGWKEGQREDRDKDKK